MHVLALCSGVGGLEMGVRLAEPGSRVVCHVERDAYAAACLVARMADQTLGAAPVWDDVGTFDGRPWRGRVDCVTAGFPCQPFSVAGSREGVNDERFVWPDIARIVGEVGPGVVLLENVPGLLARHGGMGRVLGDLSELGFDAEWGVFSAAGSGAPHLRKRVFILAHARGAVLWPEQGRGEPGRTRAAEFGDDGAQELVAHARRKLLEGWESEGATRRWWALEPGICRVVDDASHRVDRLRCLGNGVVPAVAARAWRVLKGRASV